MFICIKNGQVSDMASVLKKNVAFPPEVCTGIFLLNPSRNGRMFLIHFKKRGGQP